MKSSQSDLRGEKIESDRVECEQYDGCTRDAEYRVTNLGGNATLDALDHLDVWGSCADEWRELDHQEIRPLTWPEKWVTDDD